MPKKQKDPQPEVKGIEQPVKPRKIRNWLKSHKKLVIVFSLLLVAGGVAAGYGLLGKKPQVIVKKVTRQTEPEKPKTMASPLTGMQVAPEVAEQPIVASIVENHPDARPQSGLSDAGVVYEALAEGGITRFLAFFLDTKPKIVGPIRSIRTYFVDWTLEFNAPLMHVGGNIDALDMIGPNNVKDINQFYNANYFYRSTDRYAPHNVYSTTEKISAVLKVKGWDKKATFNPSPRTAKATPMATPDHPNITINYSTVTYKVDFQYIAASNDYGRLLANQAHIDRNTNQQIRVKNVIVQYMPTSYGKTRIGELSTRMATPGTGTAVIFRDGTAIQATWSKASHTSRTKFSDAQGKEIPLNAGNTWISVVPVGNTVAY